MQWCEDASHLGERLADQDDDDVNDVDDEDGEDEDDDEDRERRSESRRCIMVKKVIGWIIESINTWS